MGQPSREAEGKIAIAIGNRRTSSSQLPLPARVPAISPGRPGHAAPRRSVSAERTPWTQPIPRYREKVVPLPPVGSSPLEEETDTDDTASIAADSTPASPNQYRQLLSRRSSHLSDKPSRKSSATLRSGRITVVAVAEGFDFNTLSEALTQQMGDGSKLRALHEVLHVDMPQEPGSTVPSGDVFYFEYGVIVCWGLTPAQEALAMKLAGPSEDRPLAEAEVQRDELQFHCNTHAQPQITNETVTISTRQARDHHVKLAIAHALAQGSKLAVYEERVWGLVQEVRHLPESLAKHGEIRISSKQMSRLKGKIFLQKSAVNLLSSVLDTPEWFWKSEDFLQVIYERACEYLEIDARVELINARFELIQKMLGIWSDHANHHHIARLDNIIIWLMVIEVILAAFEVVGYFYKAV